jgi:hypothetical protein
MAFLHDPIDRVRRPLHLGAVALGRNALLRPAIELLPQRSLVKRDQPTQKQHELGAIQQSRWCLTRVAVRQDTDRAHAERELEVIQAEHDDDDFGSEFEADARQLPALCHRVESGNSGIDHLVPTRPAGVQLGGRHLGETLGLAEHRPEQDRVAEHQDAAHPGRWLRIDLGSAEAEPVHPAPGRRRASPRIRDEGDMEDRRSARACREAGCSRSDDRRCRAHGRPALP